MTMRAIWNNETSALLSFTVTEYMPPQSYSLCETGAC